MGYRSTVMARFNKNGQVDSRFTPRVVYRSLGKEKADGLASHILMGDQTDEPLIEVDSGLRGLLRMEAELHEAIHLILPSLPEGLVLRSGRYLSRFLWRVGYRIPE
jgi:hypothetical protein